MIEGIQVKNRAELKILKIVKKPMNWYAAKTQAVRMTIKLLQSTSKCRGGQYRIQLYRGTFFCIVPDTLNGTFLAS